MPNEEKPQDFELIELLIKEASSVTGTGVVNHPARRGDEFESFEARFQSYIDQIPSYLHSVGKEGFFPHFFLGSFSTFIDTKAAKELKIKKMYFRFDDPKILKVAVVRDGGNEKEYKDKGYDDYEVNLSLFVILESGETDSKSKKFTYDDLENILNQLALPAQSTSIRNVGHKLQIRSIEIAKTTGEISIKVENKGLDRGASATRGFKEIKEGLWNNPESDIAKLTNSDKEEVKKSLDKVLKTVSKIHSKDKNSLIYGKEVREAAHHGFIAGALVNFRYRHNLRVYLGQFAGRGYADIVLVPRGEKRVLDAIPIIIEMKAATKGELKELEKVGKTKDGSQTTPAVALKQAEDYTKGFQPNVMRVLTTANDILCVGVNLDYPSAISDITTKSRDQKITPLFNNILESIDKQNNDEITQEQLKTQIQENIERIYHTLPGTGEKGDSHYFSRFLSGQSILLDKALEVQFKKYIFIPNIITYAKFCNLLLDACDQISKPEVNKIVRNLMKEVESVDLGLVDPEIVDIVRKIKGENGKNVETIKNIIKEDIVEKDGVKEKIKEVLKNENIPTEALRPSKQPPRAAAPKKEIDPDPSYAVVTMVFIPEEDSEKLTYVMNIVEADGRAEVVSKGIPLDKLKQEIGNRKIVELNLNFNIKKQKSDFKEYFSMEVGEPISLERYSNKKTDKFKGNFKNVPYPDELKEIFDKTLESQYIPQSSSITSDSDKLNKVFDNYKGLLEKIGEGILPLKHLIEKEAHFQAVLHGVFSHYSDIRLGESQENRALVLTEFQTGRGKRIDMLVHGIKFVSQDRSAKEYIPVGLELKGPREGKTADALKDEANKQISDEYAKGVTYKTLTDGDKVAFVGVTFNEKAKDKGSLILTGEAFQEVEVRHSSIFRVSQQQPRKKFDPNSCVGQSSRSKRSINNCLFSREDVENFSKGNIDENNVDKIKIDSEKFLTYVKSSKDEAKNAQLIEFVGDKNIEGDYKYLLDKVVGDQGYERYVQNERIKDLQGDVLQQNSGLTKNPKLKSRLMNAAGGIQLIRGIHGAIVSCKDGTAKDCGLNLGGIGWSFASQPIENVMVKITPRVVTSAEKVVGKIIPGTLGKQTKFAVRVAGVKFGSTIVKGVAGAVGGVFDIIDIGISANNLVDCKNRESSDNPCGEKEIRDNIASISFSGVSFVSGVALTAAGMPVVGIGVGVGLMVGYGVYSGISNIVEYEKRYDTTHGENWSIFWRTILFQDMASDVQHLADRRNTVDSLAKEVWKALNKAPNNVVAYGVGLGEVSGNTLRPDYAKILMDKEDTNTEDLSRVIPDRIPGASRICLPKVTGQDYEKGITSSVQPPLYYCENAMVISHDSRVGMKQSGKTIVYDLQNVDSGVIVGSNKWNNNFLIYPGTTKITGGNNVANRFVLVNNLSFLGKIIGGSNSINILDLSQLAEDKVTGAIDYRFKPSAYGQLKIRINDRLLIDDYVSNNLFNYHYIGRQNKVDEILCMGYSEHFTESDSRDVIIDSGGGFNRDRKDVVESCRKVIISPYTTVKGRKSNYTFYVKVADYKGRGLYSKIDVDGTGTVVFPEIDLLSDCDQITYSKESNTLSLKINFGQNNQFTLDVRNYVEQSSNKPHFVLIDKNGSNVVPKIERSDSATIKINSFELHSEHSLGKFKDVENHYKKILNNNKDYKVLSVIRGKTQNQNDSEVPHMVFGSSGDDVINFDQGTMFARGGKGRDVYVITDDINNKEVKIDNNSDDEKIDTLFMPEVEKDFSIQQCDLYLKYNNSNIRVKNYFQDRNYRHLIIMNKKGETFIPIIESMSCSSSGKGKLVPFFHATQTQEMFWLPKDFQGDHVVIDSDLEDIEKYKDEDDLLLIREGENPFIIRIEGFYADRSKWENISYSLWNNNDLFPSPELLGNVDNVMKYEDKLRDDYERIVKEYIIDFSNSIRIEHNQKLERNTSTFVGQDKERIGVMILKDITPSRVEVSSSGADLIFRDKRSNRMVNIKGWNDNKSYRIYILEFDLGLEPIIIRRLDRFSVYNIAEIQDLINKASENYQNRGKYTPKVENDFKCLISVDGFERENKEPTYQCLGFSSLQDQISFTENSCSLEQLSEFGNKLNDTQISALSRTLQNNLLLSGYGQDVINQCSKLMMTEESNQQSKISSMVKGVEEFTCLHSITSNSGVPSSRSKNRLNLDGCLSHRKKRSINGHEEKSEQGNSEKKIISGVRFTNYHSTGDESKSIQFIDSASQVEDTGRFQDLVNKINRGRIAINHFNRVKKVSGILMHSMIAKNALADFLSSDYKGVAINLGFIGGGQGFAKVAEAASLKGLKLASEGKLLLSSSLRAASPFLARGTSAFVIYDLVNQVKAFKNGTEEALAGVVGDSIYLSVDAAEIGIEVAEAFEVLEGVSSVTGPVGAAIGAVVFIGTDIYMSVKRVDKIDEIVHLTGREKFIEGLRAFMGMEPEQYIGELMGEKQANDQLVKQGLEYLKQHNDTQRYVFPAVNVKEECERVPSLQGAQYGLREEKCRYSQTVDLNNTVLLDRKVSGIKWSRAKPDNPNGGEIFCFPQGDYQPASNYGLYLCENAIGIADLSTEKRENYTLINLGEGHDFSKGFLNSPNIFIVGNGFKKYYGGNKDDIFILQGDFIEGHINGGNGVDTVDLEKFASDVRSIQARLGRNGYISYNNSFFGMENINRIYGRKNRSDIITCDYNTKYVDGRGGENDADPDVIIIPSNSNSHEMQLIVRSSTNITNHASTGNFNYTILPEREKAQVNISLSSLLFGLPTDKHNFFFNYTISELANINIQNTSQNYNYTIRNITFSFLSSSSKGESINEKFNITISDIPTKASYVLSDNTEIKIGKNNLYAMHSTDKAIDEVVESYPAVADHLRISLFVSTNNETVVMGHGNHDIINNNFLQKSHLIGSGGENVYVITSGHETLDIENLPIPEVVIYDDFNKKNSLKDTLDLRRLVQQVNSDLSIEPISKVIRNENDLLIKLSISATGLKRDVITVRLKGAFVSSWYKELQIILNNAPMKIDDNLDLSPLPLIFDEEIIVVTSQDVEEKSELIISKEAGQYTFLYSGYDLMITSVFNADMETNKFYTICLKDFYKQPKMETLSIRFNDTEILLSNEIDRINNADSISDKLNMDNYIGLILGLDRKLLTAVKDCNLSKIRDLINQGASVNTNSSNGWTPLHWAALGGCSAAVRFLMEKGAKVDAENDINRTALHLAARKCRSSAVQLLIEKGANVDARDKDGKTPLTLASWQKELDITSGQECDRTMEYLRKLNQKEGSHVQRKRRHHHGDHDRHRSHLSRDLLAIDSSGQPEVAASSTTRPSSWINSCISWAKKLAASTFSIIPALPSQYNIADKNNVKSDNKNIPQSTLSVGWNKFLNNENIALASCVADALDNTPRRRYQGLMSKGVEVVPSSRVAVEFALEKFNSFVEDKIRNLESKEQARIHVELKDAYPEIIASLERGVEFSGNVGLDNVLEKSKKRFCANVLQKDKVSTCLSGVGVTKLENNLSR